MGPARTAHSSRNIRRASPAVLKTTVNSVKDSVKSAGPALVGTPDSLDYRFGPFRLEVGKRRLWRDDQLVPLTRKAFETLLVLLRRRGQVIEKAELLQSVWPDTFITEETLTQNIATIRRALGDSSEHPRYIATIPRRGYQFIGMVTRDGTAPKAVPEPLSINSGSRPRPALASTRILLLIGGALIVSMGLGVAYYARPTPRASLSPQEWQINPPPNTTLLSGGVLSPDGRRIAFVTIDEGGATALWVQTLGSLEQLRLPGTEHARGPIWSPGGQSVLFTASGKLKRIGLADKAPQTLGIVSLDPFSDHGGSSNSSDLIFSPMQKGAVFRLKGDGAFEPITRLAEGERVHLWPSFLPDGRHFVYRAAAYDDTRAGTYVGSLDSIDERTRLEGVTSAAVYATGYLVFVREGALVAQRFDAERRQLKGDPFVIAQSVAAPDETRGLTFSASGTVVSYLSGGLYNQLAWFDRRGLFLRALDPSAGWSSPALSPDNRQVLANRPKADVGNQLWIAPTDSGTASKLETGLPQAGLAVWSHDGRRIAFTSAGDLYWMPADGVHADLLMKAPTREEPLRLQDWSRDGRVLVYYTPDPKTGPDLWWYSIADRKAQPFLQSPAKEFQAQLSPDGHWLAYTQEAANQREVYVQRFPEGGSVQKISANGGAQPQWRQDGKELFYLSLENNLMAVEVRPGSPPRFGQPQKLFHVVLNQSLTDVRNSYAVSSDGSRFLLSARPANLPPIAVRLNWTAALQRQ
jgi:DNA-binding winged helix-turn-helix (wHTH) protein/Tol biopolymer transport system component